MIDGREVTEPTSQQVDREEREPELIFMPREWLDELLQADPVKAAIMLRTLGVRS